MEDNGMMDVEAIIKYLPEEIYSKYASRFRSCGTICKYIQYENDSTCLVTVLILS